MVHDDHIRLLAIDQGVERVGLSRHRVEEDSLEDVPLPRRARRQLLPIRQNLVDATEVEIRFGREGGKAHASISHSRRERRASGQNNVVAPRLKKACDCQEWVEMPNCRS
ncbi:hypothetical protein AKJ13_15680 [Methylobacterium sp. ARG-1]|nr:hypothetical protein AKJ13_15680 [Methylobacterium sp. ARG-1]